MDFLVLNKKRDLLLIDLGCLFHPIDRFGTRVKLKTYRSDVVIDRWIASIGNALKPVSHSSSRHSLPSDFDFDLIDNDGGGLSNDDDDDHATTNDAPGTKKRYDDDAYACDDGGVERKDDERLGHWLGWTRTRAVLETGGERVDGDAVLRARERRDRARTRGGDGKVG